MKDLYGYDEEYRDNIATVDASGKRVWVYPKKPEGKFHNYRIIVTIVLLSMLFSGPFLKIDGQPLLLLNIFERRFIILGQSFWPQDFFILALMLVTFFVFIILFTVAFGRVWCGWACPQTLFMEMVFRKIEYWIEGNANQQRKLEQSPWNFNKIIKKGSKQLIFIAISALISHTVMAYLIGIEEVWVIIQQPPKEHLTGFLGLFFFTGLFYWVFAWFREQACIAVCPYGRLQSVLLVKDSMAVMYDWLRGEPRGKVKKGGEEEKKGDCIDCNLCVHVCPTGIDIRNGTQMECVSCTACIDACDDVMLKINKPTGLIKIASYTSIKKGTKKLWNPRVIGYSIVLTFLMGLVSFFIFSRSDIDVTILKVSGTLYQKTDDGQISNLYSVQLVNKTFETQSVELHLEEGSPGVLEQIGGPKISVNPNSIVDAIFLVKIPREEISSSRSSVLVEIFSNGKFITKEKTKFLAPINPKP